MYQYILTHCTILFQLFLDIINNQFLTYWEPMINLIWLHFLMDFICQWDEMAIKKSTSFKWLVLHGFIYAMPFIYYGFIFWLITFVSHTIVDGITSRVAKYFFLREKRHWFFVTIGFDQAIHLSCLIFALNY